MTFLSPASRTYLFQTLDPLHVGTGGTRLGRVDNTVARDPATRLPKVPGSGISGAVKDSFDLHTLTTDAPERVDRTHRCAGTNGCGKKECPVCAIFGTASGDEAGGEGNKDSRRGVIAFRDAHLVAMPVASLLGPLWVSPQDFGKGLGLVTGEGSLGSLDNPTVAAPNGLNVWGQRVSLGSFLFRKAEGVELNPPGEERLSTLISFLGDNMVGDLSRIFSRMVFCEDAVFTVLVDAGMEVRTSVSIDPDTGAAKHQALFTLEAVPAGAIFQTTLDFLGGEVFFEPYGTVDILFKAIEAHGFPNLAFSGMGGNITRGFGRVRFLGYRNEGGVQ